LLKVEGGVIGTRRHRGGSPLGRRWALCNGEEIRSASARFYTLQNVRD
jgi:hypothetical protein